MADWTDIPTNNLLPGEPWTSAKAIAAFENPAAIAEGAADAPKIADKVVTGGPSTDLTISGMDDYGGAWFHLSTEPPAGLSPGGNTDMQIEFSDDGSTFYGTVAIVNLTDAQKADLTIFADFATGSVKVSGRKDTGSVIAGEVTVTGSSLSVTHVRFTQASGSITTAAIVQPQGGASAS